MANSQYFLGANTANGFYSLYDQLIDRETARAVCLLKGGPGCGKSTLMRRVAHQAEAAGLDAEYIWCSGDPDSLDGLVLPQLNVAIADATAPHILEPVCPGAVDRYVDLGQCYDTRALQPFRQDILNRMAENKKAYQQCYHCLKAVQELREDTREFLLTEEVKAKLAKRARGIVARELKEVSDRPGTVTRRFLSALTCRGVLSLWDTVVSGHSRVYELRDNFGAAHCLLTPIAQAAAARGHRVILCPAPLCPDRLQHLLIPSASLAFVTSAAESPYPGRVYRRLQLDTLLTSGELYRKNRSRVRFSRKISSSLLSEGLQSLAKAKEIHDKLEGIYHPYVDFDSVEKIADALAVELLSLPVTANP